MTREEFMEKAPAQTMTVKVEPKAFSTGSVGWSANQKTDLTLDDGTVVRCQVNVNVTVIGSKGW